MYIETGVDNNLTWFFVQGVLALHKGYIVSISSTMEGVE